MVTERALLTTGDAARLLDVSASGVRWLEATGQLRGDRTLSGQRVFRVHEVMRLVAERARQRHPRLATVRPRMARAQLRLPLQRKAENG